MFGCICLDVMVLNKSSHFAAQWMCNTRPLKFSFKVFLYRKNFLQEMVGLGS